MTAASTDDASRAAHDKAYLDALVWEFGTPVSEHETGLPFMADLPASPALGGTLEQLGQQTSITSYSQIPEPPGENSHGSPWRIGTVDLFLGQSTGEQWDLVSLSRASFVHDRIKSEGKAQESHDGGQNWEFATWLGFTKFNTNETVLVGHDEMTAGPTWWQGLGKHEFEDSQAMWNLTSETNILYSNVGNAECKPSNLSPTNGTFSYGANVSLTWAGASCASSYQIQFRYVNFDGTFTYSPIITLSGTGFSGTGVSGYYQPFRTGTHTWTVRAVASGYTTPWVYQNFNITGGGGGGCRTANGSNLPPICDD